MGHLISEQFGVPRREGGMVFRTTGAIATLLIGLGGASGQAWAQYYPPPQTSPLQVPHPQGYLPRKPLPPMADANEPQLNAPVLQGPPLPPPQGYEPATAGTGPYYSVPSSIPPGPAGSAEQDAILQDATRSRLPISRQVGPGTVDPRVTGSTQGGDPRNMAAFPPEVRPETGPKKELEPQFRRALVDYRTKEPPGTIIVDTPNTYLYLVLGDGKALRYGIGVGREGFTWTGAEKVSRMAEWPDWNPPEEMIVRQPYLPRFMAGGEGNPLGARALYLGQTLYRIHGTNQPSTIGTFVSSGCIRLTNEDIMHLYSRVKIGTRVVVLPSRQPATAVATSVRSSRGTVAPGLPSTSDMPTKRPKSQEQEIVAKLRQVDILVSQGQSLADAIGQIGVTAMTYHRWRQEFGGPKSDQAKRPKEPGQESSKRIVEGEVSVVRDTAPQSNSKPDFTGFEE
jgi:lipoprotein-anchoring transpeptidase ErfK/SrfK